MKIEAGKTYRTRDGQKVGPIVMRKGRDIDCAYPWSDDAATDDYSRWWNMHGEQLAGLVEPADLVSEWTDEPTGPVITETVKRIVPGTYGRLYLARQGGEAPRILINLADETGVSRGVSHGWSIAELRAAIDILTEVADALPEATP